MAETPNIAHEPPSLPSSPQHKKTKIIDPSPASTSIASEFNMPMDNSCLTSNIDCKLRYSQTVRRQPRHQYQPEWLPLKHRPPCKCNCSDLRAKLLLVVAHSRRGTTSTAQRKPPSQPVARRWYRPASPLQSPQAHVSPALNGNLHSNSWDDLPTK